jgi:hypothetical protein
MQPRLRSVDVAIEPCGHGGHNPHQLTAHHA